MTERRNQHLICLIMQNVIQRYLFVHFYSPEFSAIFVVLVEFFLRLHHSQMLIDLIKSTSIGAIFCVVRLIVSGALTFTGIFTCPLWLSATGQAADTQYRRTNANPNHILCAVFV